MRRKIKRKSKRETLKNIEIRKGDGQIKEREMERNGKKGR